MREIAIGAITAVITCAIIWVVWRRLEEQPDEEHDQD